VVTWMTLTLGVESIMDTSSIPMKDPHDVGQQLGEARVNVPGLLQRRGADPLHLPLHPKLAVDPDVVVRGLACRGALAQTRIQGCGLGRWKRSS
jgi:hypothetical protein